MENMRQGCKFITIGDATAIMCGGEPTDHKCNEDLIVYDFSDGDRDTIFNKARKEKMNLHMCEEDMRYFLLERGIEIRSSSVACSICSRAAIDNVGYI